METPYHAGAHPGETEVKPIDWKRLAFAIGCAGVYYVAVAYGHLETGAVSEALIVAAAAWAKVGE